MKLVKELQEKCKSSSLKKYLEQWLKESKNATNALIVEESQGAKNKKAKSFSIQETTEKARNKEIKKKGHIVFECK